jgi:serine/threonine-protein kinase HipA
MRDCHVLVERLSGVSPMSSNSDDLIVVLDAPDLGATRPVGVLSFWPDSRAIAFTYARSWRESDDAFALEPRLPLVQGLQYIPGSVPPPILRDTSPDLWGTILLERRAGRHLGPWDLLTGVADEPRMGALRLRRNDGPYIDDRQPSIPPVARLRALQAAARAFDQDPMAPVADADIALLIAPGSSLGGARPKANFRDIDGSLWIAKFPSRTDRQDAGAWEYVYGRLAQLAGVQVSDARMLSVSGRSRTFVTRRFDRVGGDRRLFASAMTLTGKNDGQPAGYLDIAQAIRAQVAPTAVREDLEQLFRRLVFNIAAGNRDDHLRNHAFLRTALGWRLAPAFDMNPGREQRQHAISIDGSTFEPDIHAALASHQVYGLTERRALEIIAEVAKAVGRWPAEATNAGIAATEQATVRVAFSALPSALEVAASAAGAG